MRVASPGPSISPARGNATVPAFGDTGAVSLGTRVMRQVAARYAPFCSARVPATFGISSARSEWPSENHHGRARMWLWMKVS